MKRLFKKLLNRDQALLKDSSIVFVSVAVSTVIGYFYQMFMAGFWDPSSMEFWEL